MSAANTPAVVGSGAGRSTRRTLPATGPDSVLGRARAQRVEVAPVDAHLRSPSSVHERPSHAAAWGLLGTREVRPDLHRAAARPLEHVEPNLGHLPAARLVDVAREQVAAGPAELPF